MTELFVQLDQPPADEAQVQRLDGTAGLVINGHRMRPCDCHVLPGPVSALLGGEDVLAEWSEEPSPVRIVDGDLETCARLRDERPEFTWLPRLIAYKPEVVYRMSDYPGEGFRFYAPDTSAIRGYRVDDGDRTLQEALIQAKSFGFSELWLHARDAAREQNGLDLDLLDRARQHFGDGIWLSGGASKPQHMVNLVREGGAKVLVVDAGLLASIGMAALTAALAPPPPPEQPIHFNLPRGPDSDPA